MNHTRGHCTVRVVFPEMLPKVAVMVVVPAATPMASPLLSTAATEGSDEPQVTTPRPPSGEERTRVDPSVYLPMARNCWKAPTGMDGTTATDDKLAEVTVSTAFPEKFPDVAVMIVGPTATAVAKPVLRPTVTTDGLDEFQLTSVLISWVVPSE